MTGGITSAIIWMNLGKRRISGKRGDNHERTRRLCSPSATEANLCRLRQRSHLRPAGRRQRSRGAHAGIYSAGILRGARMFWMRAAMRDVSKVLRVCIVLLLAALAVNVWQAWKYQHLADSKPTVIERWLDSADYHHDQATATYSGATTTGNWMTQCSTIPVASTSATSAFSTTWVCSVQNGNCVPVQP